MTRSLRSTEGDEVLLLSLLAESEILGKQLRDLANQLSVFTVRLSEGREVDDGGAAS